MQVRFHHWPCLSKVASINQIRHAFKTLSLALFASLVTKVTTSLSRYNCILSCTTHTKIICWFGKNSNKPISKVLVALTSAIECVNVAPFQCSMYLIANMPQSYLHHQMHYTNHMHTSSIKDKYISTAYLMIRQIITVKVIYPFSCWTIWGCTCWNFETSTRLSMPWAWNAWSIASDKRLDTALITLPLLKGKEDKISTLEAGILTTCTCQWLLSQTGKNSYTHIDDIAINRLVGHYNMIIKWNKDFDLDAIVLGLTYHITTREIMAHKFSMKEHPTPLFDFMLFGLWRKAG